MVDVDIANDLEQVNQQLNTEREQVTQQIHNLNGIAMYLRGKQNETEESIPERSHEYPPDEGEEV